MMHPIRNGHVNQLDDVINEVYELKNVSQVFSVTGTIFRKLYQELDFDKDRNVRHCHLNKRTVSKEKLAEWLETVCYVLDLFNY